MDIGQQNELHWGWVTFQLSLVQIIIISIVLGYVVFAFYRRAVEHRADLDFSRRHGCKPTKATIPYKWPLAIDIIKQGWDANMEGKILAYTSSFFDNPELGPTIEPVLLGGLSYWTIDPENIKAILDSQFEEFHLGARNHAMRTMLGDGIFTQDGEAAKHSRKLLSHHFQRMQYQSLAGFRPHVENLVNALESSQGIVDLQPLFFRLTLDTTTDMIFGQSTNSLKFEGQDVFLKNFNEASFITATRVRLGVNYWLYTPPRFLSVCKAVKKYLHKFVQDALPGGDSKQHQDERNKFAFIEDLYSELNDTEIVRDQLVNVLLAGRDTTASLLSYTFRLLVRYPSVLDKLREEIVRVVGPDIEVTRAHIKRMPYLRCVINETLRLFPPAPINVRFAKKRTCLPRGGGPDGQSPVMVRAGIPVAYSLYHMHRRTDIYGSDAREFRPERWGQDGLADFKWAFKPFNGGPRVCLGQDFAFQLASYAIVRVIQQFSTIDLPPGESIEAPGAERQVLTLVLSSADGCRVLLRS